MSGEAPPGGRSPAEWTTLAISSAVLAVVIALLVGEMLSTRVPAAPRSRVAAIEAVGERFRVAVTVTNDGDDTAANVQVTAELVSSGGTESGDLSIDFLAGGEEQRLVFLFDDDPGAGELTVAVTGYEDP